MNEEKIEEVLQEQKEQKEQEKYGEGSQENILTIEGLDINFLQSQIQIDISKAVEADLVDPLRAAIINQAVAIWFNQLRMQGIHCINMLNEQ